MLFNVFVQNDLETVSFLIILKDKIWSNLIYLRLKFILSSKNIFRRKSICLYSKLNLSWTIQTICINFTQNHTLNEPGMKFIRVHSIFFSWTEHPKTIPFLLVQE